ncbi:MAG: hypothetical protein FWE42_06540 [Defluviitaleaceae bacterium]|nr:hypothetical protein [Defluviitaleaceae bacterium]
MTPIKDHIQQTKHLLQQLLESGFLTGRGFETDLSQCSQTAQEMGLTTGSQLLNQLSETLTKLRAGQGTFDQAALIYSAITSYYDFAANQATIIYMTKRAGDAVS